MSIQHFFYLDEQNTRRGPFTPDQLSTLPLHADTLVWHEALPDWAPLREVTELWAEYNRTAPSPISGMPKVSPAPPPASTAPPQVYRPTPSPPTFGQATMRTNTVAMFALVLAAAGAAWWCLPGWVFVAAPLSLAAIALAIVALAKSRQSGGKGLAIAGLVLGIANFCLAAVMLIVIGLFVGAEAARNTRSSRPPTFAPPAVPATIPAMPRFHIEQPKFPTSFPTTRDGS